MKALLEKLYKLQFELGFAAQYEDLEDVLEES